MFTAEKRDARNAGKLMSFRQFWAIIVAAFLVVAGGYGVLAISRPDPRLSDFTYMPLGDSFAPGYSAS